MIKSYCAVFLLFLSSLVTLSWCIPQPVYLHFSKLPNHDNDRSNSPSLSANLHDHNAYSLNDLHNLDISDYVQVINRPTDTTADKYQYKKLLSDDNKNNLISKHSSESSEPVESAEPAKRAKPAESNKYPTTILSPPHLSSPLSSPLSLSQFHSLYSTKMQPSSSAPLLTPNIILLISFFASLLFFVLIILVLSLIKYFFLNKNFSSIKLTNVSPGSFDDEQYEIEHFNDLSPNDQILFKQAKLFFKLNPPNFKPNNSLSLSQCILIQEKGIMAYDFLPNSNLPKNIVNINEKFEINFKNNSINKFLNANYGPISISTNLPIPTSNDVYYFESKIFDVDYDSISQNQLENQSQSPFFSIGLSTMPYPFFRLPGRHPWSIAYDSNGSRRFNNSFPIPPPQSVSSSSSSSYLPPPPPPPLPTPVSALAPLYFPFSSNRTFPPSSSTSSSKPKHSSKKVNESNIFPKILKGDVIGIGYKTKSGAIFFTRNGKKLSESKIGGHVKNIKKFLLYPIIGSSINCSIHLNFGQCGFVYIEANVKKWGFTKDIYGNQPPPPLYSTSSNDLLLQSSNFSNSINIISRNSSFSSLNDTSNENLIEISNDDLNNNSFNNYNNSSNNSSLNSLSRISSNITNIFNNSTNGSKNGNDSNKIQKTLNENIIEIPNFPPPFWASSSTILDNITLNTISQNELPPIYTSDNELNQHNTSSSIDKDNIAAETAGKTIKFSKPDMDTDEAHEQAETEYNQQNNKDSIKQTNTSFFNQGNSA
ncbi:SPRY-domain-containing protein [Ascoidea rubescens DSM 1968]|uniref:SPRY-domain-containing protein n=1 Tax=Ascoidea rubescens DSM 1968 TaxID=1344418 RepID=A0A1D2VDN6_9ASCO|nr:SPRY-domain-containing protein [Ascoidea rubescens DSM 1968]ODV59603.1 SPRY-domain-containing protein [Ascoidea rubescens DSM 1968]